MRTNEARDMKSSTLVAGELLRSRFENLLGSVASNRRLHDDRGSI